MVRAADERTGQRLLHMAGDIAADRWQRPGEGLQVGPWAGVGSAGTEERRVPASSAYSVAANDHTSLAGQPPPCSTTSGAAKAGVMA